MSRALLLIQMLMVARLCAATYYISAAGSDAANGLTEGTAWLTPAHAQTQLAASDTLKSRRDDVFLLTATFEMPADGITLSAYGTGALPVWDGQSVLNEIIDCAAAQNTITEYLDLRNGGPEGGDTTGGVWTGRIGTNTLRHFVIDMHTTDAGADGAADAHIIVQDGVIRNCADDGLTLHSTASALVQRVIFYRNGTGINNSGTAMAMTVEDCWFLENLSGDYNASVTTSTFRRNRFLGPVAGDTSFKFYNDQAASNTTFEACSWNFSPAAAGVASEFVTKGNVTINNGTLYGGGAKGKFSVDAGGIVTGTNTIFSGLYSAAQSPLGGTFDLTNCLRFNIDAGRMAHTTDTNPATGDPLFVDTAAGNFRLSSASSPASNAGIAIVGHTRDLANHAVGNPPEIGAYEYYAGGNVTAGNLSVGTLSIGP